MELKTTLFGYSKLLVDLKFKEMKKREEELAQDLFKQQNIVADLEKQLDIYKSKEKMITETLIDAKKTANQIIQEAKDRASDLVSDTDNLLKSRVEAVEQILYGLEQGKQQILDQEFNMKLEWTRLLERQIHMLESIDLAAYENISYNTDNEISSVKNVIGEVQSILSQPLQENVIVSDDNVPIFSIE